jgi:hypothetical protein
MYRIEEQVDETRTAILGAPFTDLLVAKVVASRRARQTHRSTVVRDNRTGEEIVRYPAIPARLSA